MAAKTEWQFTYHWSELSKGAQGTSVFKSPHPLSQQEKLTIINTWNSRSDSWKYWLED